MDLSLFFAGTAGSVPTARRGLPALLVRRGGEKLLFDCGEGTQRQLLSSIGLPEIDAVFLTHFHTDHWLGLPGMLKSFELRDRESPLTVYGPPGTADLLGTVRRVIGRLRYPFAIVELGAGDAVPLEDAEVSAFNVRHRGQSYGYALVEDERPGRFDAELAQSLGVAFGPDFGRLQRGEVVDGVAPEQVIGPARPGRKAEVLVHEATFLHEDAARARETGHSTARQAAELAAEAQVRMLVLTHLSTRYSGREIRDEARAIFAHTEVPRDFDLIEVPLPEKGEPELQRASGDRAPAG
jgi:ribonuclease Z